jgi:hypothetical protein
MAPIKSPIHIMAAQTLKDSIRTLRKTQIRISKDTNRFTIKIWTQPKLNQGIFRVMEIF